MSLSTHDLKAIQNLIETTEGRLTPHFDGLTHRLDGLTHRLDELDDTLSQQIEHGLEEIRQELQVTTTEVRAVKDTVSRIERIQKAEIQRDDLQDKTIRKIRTALRAI